MNNQCTVNQYEDNMFQFQFDPSMYIYLYYSKIIIDINRHIHKKKFG